MCDSLLKMALPLDCLRHIRRIKHLPIPQQFGLSEYK